MTDVDVDNLWQNNQSTGAGQAMDDRCRRRQLVAEQSKYRG